LKVISC